jgi:methylmalonyl-CoA/ethylmalonyl-CoA epimerase
VAASDIKDVLQIGIVTADLDRAMRAWTDTYGVGPWQVSVYNRSNMSDWTVDDGPADFEMRSAIARTGGFMIELIQPISGESTWSESLARHGGADHIHHLLCTYADDDFDTTLTDFRRKGVPAVQIGHQGASGIRWAYLDSLPELGCLLELVQVPGGLPARKVAAATDPAAR